MSIYRLSTALGALSLGAPTVKVSAPVTPGIKAPPTEIPTPGSGIPKVELPRIEVPAEAVKIFRGKLSEAEAKRIFGEETLKPGQKMALEGKQVEDFMDVFRNLSKPKQEELLKELKTSTELKDVPEMIPLIKAMEIARTPTSTLKYEPPKLEAPRTSVTEEKPTTEVKPESTAEKKKVAVAEDDLGDPVVSAPKETKTEEVAKTQPEKTTREQPKVDDDMPDPEIVKVMEKLFPELEAALPTEKAKLEALFDGLGEVQARAKKPVSGANRLERTVKNGWATELDRSGAPRKITKIETPEQAKRNLWDAIGTRLVVKDTSPASMDKVVAKIVEGINNGSLKPTQINNLRGPNGKPYFTDAQLRKIQDAAAAKGLKVKVNNVEASADKSPFTAVCMYLDHGNGIIGEFQLIGPKALEIANAEHLPYDASLKKDLYRELSPTGKAKMEPEFEPFRKAMQNLSPDQQKLYNEYLNQCYIHARNLESGIESTPPKLPDGLDSKLSMENILRIEGLYQKVKAEHPKYAK